MMKLRSVVGADEAGDCTWRGFAASPAAQNSCVIEIMTLPSTVDYQKSWQDFMTHPYSSLVRTTKLKFQVHPLEFCFIRCS
jgi:hypothetical protein